MPGAQADRGIFVTTSRFTNDAQDYAERVAARLVLIDGRAGGQMVAVAGGQMVAVAAQSWR